MALSLDDDGTAYMVHRDETNDELRHSVVYTGTVWRTEALASTGEVTFGNPGTSLSFVDDTMHMTYINATSGMLEHITQNPAGAAASVVDGDGFTVGLYTSIALDGSGQQHVAYHNASATSLVYARQEGTSWSVEEIDNTASVGYYPSIALDNDGRPHISYVDSGSDYLKYAHYNGSGWEIAIIDDLTNDVFDTSIAVNDTGHPQIAYSIRNYSSCLLYTSPSPRD